jgi:hypothetical protein
MGEPFRVVVLKQHWHDLGHPHAGIGDRLQGLDLAQARMVIEADSIQAFRSADWSFVLTPQVSRRMEEQFGEWLDDLTILKGGFILALGSRKLCAGVFIESGAAAAIDFPVIYAEKVGGQFVLYLRATHSLAGRHRKVDVGSEQALGIALVTSFFREQGKLVEQ